MIELLEYLQNNPWILFGAFYALEKFVKKSKWEWDDILFDMLIDPIINSMKKKQHK
jgi:hypothetical protein